MITYYFLLVILLFYGSRFRNGFNSNYIAKSSTNVIKGLFIALIFMSHIQGYIQKSGYEYTNWGDDMVLGIQEAMGQLVVVMFLFYSGYGVMEQYRLKVQAYVSTMPKKRILTTLLNFDVAVCLFILADLLLGVPISFSQCLQSLISRNIYSSKTTDASSC